MHGSRPYLDLDEQVFNFLAQKVLLRPPWKPLS